MKFFIGGAAEARKSNISSIELNSSYSTFIQKYQSNEYNKLVAYFRLFLSAMITAAGATKYIPMLSNMIPIPYPSISSSVSTST